MNPSVSNHSAYMAEQRPEQRQKQLFSLEELNRIVLEFLHKKGYIRTEAMLRLESSRAATPQTSDGFVQSGTIPMTITGYEAYGRVYLALKEWVETSLDLYQPELRRVLYPVFVHMYLDLLSDNHPTEAHEFFDQFEEEHEVLHQSEINELRGLQLPNHVQENELAQQYMTNKYRVQMSRTAFDLLLYFLHNIEAVGGLIVIRLINQHMEMQVTNGQPSLETPIDSAPGQGLIGSQLGSQSIDAFNSQNVKLGRLPLDQEFQQEVTAMLKQDTDPANGDLPELFEELTKPETDSPAVEALPLPKYRPIDIDIEIKKITDAKHRIELGSPQAPLPSVCMYTFHNTHDEMNTLAFSADNTLMAGGFADSYVQLWSLKGEKLTSVIKEDKHNSPTRRLVGHSGSVFGLSFAPDGRTLLSSSEDSTVRLWSLDTYSALVSYKGHTDPVWDVAYGPFGHYFATASHDQTARLWSCDHIYPLRIFAGHMSDVDNVCFHPNGTYLFTGSSDKTVRMWDINKGSSVRVFIGHTLPVSAIAVSPDGRWLATAGEDSVINVWDIGSGRRLKSMRGHGKASIYSLTFSKEGSLLVSGGADNSVRVWDIKKNTQDAGSEPEPIDAPPKLMQNGQRKKKEIVSTNDHMAVFNTKRTPVYKVQFTNRNLVLAGGAFSG